MVTMKIYPTPISGLLRIETKPYADERGSFSRFFCEQELSGIIRQRRIVQINYSLTNCVGAIRGLHYQRPPHSEMKLIRCLKGRVWDVSVDLRKSSPTYLRWHAEELSATNARMVVIPEGFAHGYQVLEPDSELLYLHTAFYEPQSEGGLRHDDPLLNINWPNPVTDLSFRDANHSLIGKNTEDIYP